MQDRLRKIRQISTLLKHRDLVDEELATRNGVEIDAFKQVHSNCGQLQTTRVGWHKLGYNPTWNDYEYAPIKTAYCPKHNTTSLQFIDIEAYMKGEVGSG